MRLDEGDRVKKTPRSNSEVIRLLPGLSYQVFDSKTEMHYWTIDTGYRDCNYEISYPSAGMLIINKKRAFEYQYAYPFNSDDDEPKSTLIKNMETLSKKKEVIETLLLAYYYISKTVKSMQNDDPKLPALLEQKRKLETCFTKGCSEEEISDIVGEHIVRIYKRKSKEYQDILNEKAEKARQEQESKKQKAEERKEKLKDFKNKLVKNVVKTIKKSGKFLIAPVKYYGGIAKVYYDGNKAQRELKAKERAKKRAWKREKNKSYDF